MKLTKVRNKELRKAKIGKTKIRITAVAISLAMLVTMIPVSFAFADESANTDKTEPAITVDEGTTEDNAMEDNVEAPVAGGSESNAVPAENKTEKSVSETQTEEENEIVLKKPVISQATVSTTSLKISWGKDTKCEGYIILLAEDKAFSKNVRKFTNKGSAAVTRTVSGISKSKRYYVKVCEYISVEEADTQTGEPAEIVCGEYSDVVSLKYLRPWSNCYEIKHACGKIGKSTYTNSLEALKKSLLKNSPAIEIDFDFTCDGVLVCTHGFDGFKKTPTYKQFMAKKIKGRYTPMTAETALKLMAGRFNTYLVVDCKGTATPIYREINRLLVETGKGYYRPNVVPQIYYGGDYRNISKIYKYKNWIFTTYKLKMRSVKAYIILIKFCRKKGIRTITIPKSRAKKKQMTILKKAKFMIGVHTVKTLKEYRKYRKAGGKFIYSDI